MGRMTDLSRWFAASRKARGFRHRAPLPSYRPESGSHLVLLSPGSVELPPEVEARLGPEVIRKLNQAR